MFIGFAIPFVVAFVTDREKNTWAVIPAAIFGMLTLTALIGDQAAGQFFGALVVFAIADAVLLHLLHAGEPVVGDHSGGHPRLDRYHGPHLRRESNFRSLDLKNALFLLGFAATFGVVYLRRNVHSAAWAKYPAIVFSFIAMLALIDKTGIDGGPLILIALGVLLLFSTVRPRQHPIS